jgi:hypothetical protein
MVRFASRRNALQVRSAPHPLATLLAALVCVIIVGGVSAPAMAHAGHNHRAAKIAATSTPRGAAPLTSVEKTWLTTRVVRHGLARYTFSSHRMSPPLDGERTCCCGSFSCHACVTLQGQAPQVPVAAGERMVPGLSDGMVEHRPSRLDRPPRSTHSA